MTIRHGFSFVELLFALMVMGVGMVMLAGVLPVAIVQTRATVDETSAARIARGAVATMSRCLRGRDVPPAPGVRSLREISPQLWSRLRGELIDAADPQYAWVPLIRHEGPGPLAQVFVFVLRDRNASRYEAARDLTDVPGETGDAPPATLEPKLARVTVRGATTSGGVGTVTVGDAAPGSAAAVAEGAWMVVCNDGLAGAANGRIFRVGNPVEGHPGTWELYPGDEDAGVAGNLTNARAFFIGQGWSDPTNPSKGFDGPAQDIAVYTTWILLPG